MATPLDEIRTRVDRLESCPWWSRWLHRRQRQSDRTVMMPAIVSAAKKAGKTTDEIFKAWVLFTAQKGQEHWHCPCATKEAAMSFVNEMGDAVPS